MSDQLTSPQHVPIRMCLGCRQRAERGELLRLVIAEEPGLTPRVVPDPSARLAGRGGWIHPNSSCWTLAVRRRAPARAFRHAGPLDLSAVEEYLVATS